MWVSGLMLGRLPRVSERRACKMLRRHTSLAMAAATTITSILWSMMGAVVLLYVLRLQLDVHIGCNGIVAIPLVTL